MNIEILNQVGNWIVAILMAFFSFIFLCKLYVLACGGSEKIQKENPHPLDGVAGISFIIMSIIVAKYFWPYF